MAFITEYITPQWLKDTVLQGVKLTNPNDKNKPFPDEVFLHAISAAIDLVESELDIHLGRYVVQEEAHDVETTTPTSWMHTALKHRPVQSVQSIGLKYGGFDRHPLPASWVQIRSREAGYIQFMASEESLEIGGGGNVPLVVPSLMVNGSYLPMYLRIGYTAGMEYDHPGTAEVTDGSATVTGTDTRFLTGDVDKGVPPVRENRFIAVGDQVRRVKRVKSETELVVDTPFERTEAGEDAVFCDWPPALLDAVGMIAAMLPLDIAGDLIIGAGIASKSTGFDGYHESINTTSSATNAGYGAKIKSYQARLKETWRAIKRRYRPIRMAIV